MFLYLALLMDRYSRRIVGWDLQSHMKESLVLAALRAAIALRRPPPGLVHHTDRGGQYAGADYQALHSEITMEDVLNQLGFVPANQTGDQLHGPCPHPEGTRGSTSAGRHRSQSGRSLSINLETGRYYCHKCQSHGNQLELWSAVHRLPIYEAAIDLCRALGRDVPCIERR